MPRLFRLGIAPGEMVRAQVRWLLERIDSAARVAGAEPAHVERVEICTPAEETGELFVDAEASGAAHAEALRQALRLGQVDIVLHHLGDRVEARGLVDLAAVLERVHVGDVLLGSGRLEDLQPGARVAVGSLRTRAQLCAARPDVHPVHLRGGPRTCLEKLRATPIEALILPAALVAWLGEEPLVCEDLAARGFVPGAGHGALAIEVRLGDDEAHAWAARLEHPPTRLEVAAELACIERLERVDARGARARLDGGRLRLEAFASGPDGEGLAHRIEDLAPPADARAAFAAALQLGRQVGEELASKTSPIA
jgi:hydroxymethylbilane synthase